MTDIQTEVSRVLPLRVTDHGITGPFFNVYGDGWSLAINCNWSLIKDGDLLGTWEAEEDELQRVVATLRDKSIVDFKVADNLRDPVITFDDGTTLLVEADTDLDPWVLHAEGLPVVLVGAGPRNA